MLDHFKGFIRYKESEFVELWEEAIFVVDTNILLNFYKYTSRESTKSLLDILKQLKDKGRLWIPHQVALEYFFNHEENMSKQKEGYDLLGKELIKLEKEANSILSTVKSKHPYIMTDQFKFYIDNLTNSNQQLQDVLNEEVENLPNTNEIQKDLLSLLNGVIGEPYSQEKIDEIEKVGKERYHYEIPPGFEDKKNNKKQDFRNYGDFKYQQLYGDLIAWYQIIDRAKNEESSTPVILITEDRKEDWWEKKNNKIVRPHPQLIQEFFNKTGKNFYMYRTETFIMYAIKYLNVNVTDEEVKNVTKDVEQIRKSEEKEYLEQSRLRKVFTEESLENSNKNVEINDLMEYLSSDEKEHFRVLLGQSFTNNLNSEQMNLKYYEAISWAIYKALNQIEYKFKDLVGKLSLLSLEKVQSYIPTFNNLPTNPVDKGLQLLGVIREIEKEIKEIEFLNELPF